MQKTVLVLGKGMLFLLLISFAGSLLAAPPPSPGTVQSTLPTAPAPKPAPSPPLPVATPAVPGVAPGGPAVLVKHFEITGNTLFSEAELQAQVAGYVGRQLTLLQLYEVADVLTRYYRAHGYGLAYVSLPAQTLQNGSVRFQVVEGHLGTVSFAGNTRTRETALQKQVSNLQSGAVYRDADMERAVLLLNDLPGVQARAVLSPGASFGSSDALFNLAETPYDGSISVDDYGRSVIGRWRVNANADVNSLTGHGDQLSAGITHAESNLLNFGKLAYSLPMGPAGGTLTAAFNRAEYHVGGSLFGPLNIGGSTQNGSLNYSYAALRTREQSFWWGFGVSHNTSRANVFGQDIVTTNINLLQLTALYSHTQRDQGYYTLGGSLWTNGKHNDGSKNNAERLRLEFDGSYVQPLGTSWSLIGRGSAEYSPDPLVDTDKYSLGGPDSVRGFLPAEQRGDRALFASLEVQRSLYLGGLPTALGGFVDSGKLWSSAVSFTPASKVVLTSVGAEWILGAPTSRWNARLQWAWAVGGYRPSDNNKGGHLWFTLGMKF